MLVDPIRIVIPVSTTVGLLIMCYARFELKQMHDNALSNDDVWIEDPHANDSDHSIKLMKIADHSKFEVIKKNWHRGGDILNKRYARAIAGRASFFLTSLALCIYEDLLNEHSKIYKSFFDVENYRAFVSENQTRRAYIEGLFDIVRLKIIPDCRTTESLTEEHIYRIHMCLGCLAENFMIENRNREIFSICDGFESMEKVDYETFRLAKDLVLDQSDKSRTIDLNCMMALANALQLKICIYNMVNDKAKFTTVPIHRGYLFDNFPRIYMIRYADNRYAPILDNQ